MTNELEQYIESYFGVVQPEELKAISSQFKLTTEKKGDYFLKAGRQADKLSFIKSEFVISFPSYFSLISVTFFLKF